MKDKEPETNKFLKKIERGIQQADGNETLSDSEVAEQLQENLHHRKDSRHSEEKSTGKAI